MPRGKRNWRLPVGRARFERAMGQHRVDPATHQAQNAQNSRATHPLPLALLIRDKTEPALLLDQDKPALEGRMKKITNGCSQQHQTENDRDGCARRRLTLAEGASLNPIADTACHQADDKQFHQTAKDTRTHPRRRTGS